MLKHPQLTEGRICALLPRLERLIYQPSEPVEVAIWTVGGEPVSPSKAFQAKYRPFAVGERWGALWDTVWFRFRGKIPREWKGREVVVRIALTRGGAEGFTAEGLIYQNGKLVRALNINRREVEITANAKGGESFEFFVEAAANRGTTLEGASARLNLPDYGGKPIFRLEQAEMACVNREALDLHYDYKLLTEAMLVLPEDTPRRSQLRAALNEAANRFDAEKPASLRSAKAALKNVLSCRNGDTTHTLSAVGHAHIDTAWLWPLRETIRKCARTFSTALDYMERYPEYVFVCSQAQQYAWMKAYYPDIWSGIKKAIRRGQWEPVGSMWVEADCNLVSGESLVRQILHGKRFFEEELGYETRDVWIPDVFGYAASLPQIMKKSGVDYFLTQKMSWSQFNKFPHHTFLWEGIDGTRIFTHFPPADTYNAVVSPAELVHNVKNFKEHDRATRSLLIYGYGDGGGGPSMAMLENLRRLRDFEGLPKVEPEKAIEFFKKAKADAQDPPIWVGELYLELHRGTYTTQAKNKLGNRKSEFLLREAEFFDAVTATLAPERRERAVDPIRAVYDVTGLGEKGVPTHRSALDRAWKLILLNQFHDIIPGSSIHWVYQDSARDYETIRLLAESVRDSALSTLEGLLDTRVFTDPILITNTLGFSRREVVDLPDGRPVCVTVPPCGYKVMEAAPPALDVSEVPVKASASRRGITLENGLVRIKISPKGHLTSVYDFLAGREVLAGPGNVFHLHQDIPLRYDAWDVDAFHQERYDILEGLESLELVESGPLRASIRVVRTFGQSRLAQKIVLRAGSPRIDFVTEVEWLESQKFLKVAFPVEIHSSRATYEIQYGQIERPTHMNTSWDMAKFEVCAQKWADLSEPGYGVALLNDCKYGYDIHENVPLRLQAVPSCAGALPASHSFFQTDQPGIVIEAVKRAEDGDDIIIRLYEGEGVRGVVQLTTSLPVRRAWVTNLLEKPEKSLPLKSGTVRLPFKPFEILTVRLAG